LSGAIERYGPQLDCIALVPNGDARRDLAWAVVAAFFDLYAYERGWAVRKGAQDDSFSLLDALRADLFPATPTSWPKTRPNSGSGSSTSSCP